MNKLVRFLASAAALCLAPALVLAEGGCLTDQNGKVFCGPADSTCALDSLLRELILCELCAPA